MSAEQRVQSRSDDHSVCWSDGRIKRSGRIPRAATALAALIALAGCHGVTHQQQRDQAERHWSQVRARVKLQLATQQYEVGQIEAAITTVREAIGLDPISVPSHLLLSRAFLEQGDLPNAGRVLDAAEGLGLEAAELCYMRGVIAERSRRLVEALADFERAARLDPDQKDYLVARAECLVAVGRPEEACALVVESADRFDRDGTLDTLLAEILLLLHDEAGAAAAFRRALPLVDDNELVVEQYGLLLTRLNRPAEALAVLQPLVENRREQPGREVIVRWRPATWTWVSRLRRLNCLENG
ncbi:MAG: tetratricopeptide repeat protein [Planctomycetes bacterium]|nr:tetratricopeptide repeat protein [Planctomycetota bacterium]